MFGADFNSKISRHLLHLPAESLFISASLPNDPSMLSLITATLPCASKLLVQIITTSLPAMANHKSGALFLLLLLHHSLISALADRSPREYTNEFAVHLKECSDSQAQDLAHRYGFVNNGKVSRFRLAFVCVVTRFSKLISKL